MKTIDRYLRSQVERDLSAKMVFVGGPRQVGKTTLALQIAGSEDGYLNWDVPEHRERILRRELPTTGLWIFDEIHKYRTWRTYLKGIYDNPSLEKKILVTGSARLDLLRRGGDSLQGRYHYLRLHPFSLAELGGSDQDTLEQLLELGGFPEPFLAGSRQAARRWSRQYRERLVYQEIAGVEQVVDLGNLELLVLRLPELVGSPLSVNALREDLRLSHKTVEKWLQVLERLYAIFRLAPLGAPRIRAVRKMQKHYQVDWSLVPQPGPRFENLVACHLLKWVHYRQDVAGEDVQLRYFRDLDGREVDFVVVTGAGREPVLAVECKLTDTAVVKPLVYLKRKFPECRAWQITASGTRDATTAEGIRLCPARVFLSELV